MLAPQYKYNLQIFKLKETGCLVKHSPVIGPIEDPFHFSLYKCDNFEETPPLYLEYIQNIKLEVNAV